MVDYILIILLVIIAAYSLFAAFGKDIFERIIYFNQINSLVVLFIAILASYDSYNFYIDIAILYSLFSFISSKILIYYFRNKT
jgi:multisubunit Na+/H+ antiporter MnhF subunit